MKTEILTLLRETDGYVSGQELCEKFGVSRTAVWKAINQLKEAGYEIEAVQNKGYRLVSVPDILSESELQSVRKTRWIGEKIAFFDVVDSTNTRAKQLAEEGAPNGTYVIAERQDAGKGRRGRGFDSPAGQGIWMTLVLKPEIDPNHASMITLVTALAVSKAITDMTGRPAGIKWPNDIIMSGKKVCGILTEMSAQFDYVNQFNEKYKEDGIIWFLECCDLNVMGIRRAMWQMKNAGWFQHVKGFLIGRPCCIGEEMMGLDHYHAVTDILKDFEVPIIMDMDIGHRPPMMPLVCGSMAEVCVKGNDVTIDMKYI